MISEDEAMAGRGRTKGGGNQAEIFSQPEIEIQSATPSTSPQDPAPRPDKPRRTAVKPKPTPTPQRYLPGLSRRGRPRVPNPVPAAERAAAHRQRRLEAGDKRVEVLLPAAAITALDSLCALWGEPRAAVLARLLTTEVDRLARRGRQKSALAGRRSRTRRAARSPRSPSGGGYHRPGPLVSCPP